MMECLFQNENLQFFWRNQGEGELSTFSDMVLSNMTEDLTLEYIPGIDNYNFLQLRYQSRPHFFYDHFPRLIHQLGEQTVQYVQSGRMFRDPINDRPCDIYKYLGIILTSSTCNKKSTRIILLVFFILLYSLGDGFLRRSKLKSIDIIF